MSESRRRGSWLWKEKMNGDLNGEFMIDDPDDESQPPLPTEKRVADCANESVFSRCRCACGPWGEPAAEKFRVSA